jgi:glycosyltransferase involved in cell wall biosynthesis
LKILFDHSSPFLLAHGGFQTQIEETKRALEKLGVSVEFLRWWDGKQHGDLIHFFSPADNSYLKQARALHLPVVMTTLFTETCNRLDAQLARQKWLIRIALALPGAKSVTEQLAWRSFHNCTQNVVGLEAERTVLETVYGVPSARISVIPLGLSDMYLAAGPGTRNKTHLISTGTITQRKNCIELAEMAHATETPILFVGKPYHIADPYWLRFKDLIDGRCVTYQPHVDSESEMIALLQAARGFVLMSDYENWSLSAHEAAACGLPLLVPDQKWSRERFAGQAQYFARRGDSVNQDILRQFYAAAPSLPPPEIKLYSWLDTARSLQALYARVLNIPQ